MSDRIYVRGFPSEFTLADLKKFFRQFGKIKNACIIKESEGTPKLYGIVRYLNSDYATAAINGAHLKTIGNISWYVAICERKYYRQRTNRAMYKNALDEKFKLKNIVIRGFPSSWTEETLKEVFGKYGVIKSTKIIGLNALVLFETAEAAKDAIQGERNMEFESKKICISYWKSKEQLTRQISNAKLLREYRRQTAAWYAQNPISNSSSESFDSLEA